MKFADYGRELQELSLFRCNHVNDGSGFALPPYEISSSRIVSRAPVP